MQLIFFIAILVLGITLFAYSNVLSKQLQEVFIRSAKDLYGNAGEWSKPHTKTLLRALIIFFGIIVMLAAYPIVYGAITI